MLFCAAGISWLRSKKTWLSQSTYVCIKVLTQSTKTAGETVLRYEKCLHSFIFCDAMMLKAFGFVITWWCFHLRQRWERTAHRIKSHIISVLENTITWLVRNRLAVILQLHDMWGREEAILSPQLSFSVRRMKAYCRLWWEGFVALCPLMIFDVWIRYMIV